MSVDATGASASSVTGAIRQAAHKTGTNFNYLLATARVESNLNPSAQASSSSAGGLFQFIEQTWLGTLKHAGPALGYGRYADAVTMTSSGRFEVQDPGLRQQILSLRNDPSANALMAGAFTKWNGDWLAAKLGRAPTEGELYLAHFLGAAGASKLITTASTSPQANAAAVFPRAAGANRSIFYDKQGEPRSVAQVYRQVVGRYDLARARPPVAPATMIAERAATPLAVTSLAASQPTSAPALLTVPLPHLAPLMAPLLAPLSSSAPPASTADAAPVFHGLFRTSARREAVAPVVSALWGAPTAPAAQTSQPNKQNPARHGGMLDLFRDIG
jgi:hypothetical protein